MTAGLDQPLGVLVVDVHHDCCPSRADGTGGWSTPWSFLKQQLGVLVVDVHHDYCPSRAIGSPGGWSTLWHFLKQPLGVLVVDVHHDCCMVEVKTFHLADDSRCSSFSRVSLFHQLAKLLSETFQKYKLNQGISGTRTSQKSPSSCKIFFWVYET